MLGQQISAIQTITGAHVVRVRRTNTTTSYGTNTTTSYGTELSSKKNTSNQAGHLPYSQRSYVLNIQRVSVNCVWATLQVLRDCYAIAM